VHAGVNKVVAHCVTILLPYPKFPNSYETRDVEVVRFLLTQEGMKYTMPRVLTPGTGWEYAPEPILTALHGHLRR
jgi:hypothetical protein